MANTTTYLNNVAFESATPVNINGKETTRLWAVYRTVGCAYDKNGKGCTMCNFSHYANPHILDDNILRQHVQILDQLKFGKYEQFDLLTLGNFFNDDEISDNLRRDLIRPLAKMKNLHRILVESRFQYITEKKIMDVKNDIRNDQKLELGFGYETFSEKIRNGVLNKSVSEYHLDEVLRMCSQTKIDFVSYVLIKPHTLTEHQGIMEAVNTAIHVLKKAKKQQVQARIAFEPVFVVQHKVIEELYLKGEYTPPRLWSIIEILRLTIERLGADFQKGSLFVGLSDENLSEGRSTSNCEHCTKYIYECIQQFNADQDIDKLTTLTCEHCKKDWERLIRPSDDSHELHGEAASV